MKFNTLTIVRAVLLVGLLASCTGNAAGEEQPKPIGISIWCTRDTPSVYRVKYQRASGALPAVKAIECADMTESIPYLLPSAVDVEYVTLVRSWMVSIVLNERDASRLKSLIARNLGKAMLIDVNKQVLSVALLVTPMSGNKIYIRVESEGAGRQLEKHFVR